MSQFDEQSTIEGIPTEAEKPAEKKGLFGRKKKEKVKKSVGREILEWVITIVAALLIAFVIRSFVFEFVRVDGESMMDTLQNGEIMLTTKFEYSTLFLQWPWAADKDPHTKGNTSASGDCTCARYTIGDPKRYDVVICRYPGRGDTNFVKRIIGMPGDTIKLENGVMYVKAAGETDYTQLEEKYITDEYRSGWLNSSLISAQWYGNGQFVYTLNDDGSFTVPEGQYFVVGDHRNNSNDSRMQGPIDRNMIVGKVAAVVWPLNKIRSVPNGLDVK